MKGEMLRGVDGRIFRQGTGLGLGRGQTIYQNHRHSGAIPGNTPDERKSGCIPDFSDSRVYGGDTVTIEESWYNGYPRSDALDTQQADEMFNLFINVDECEDIMI
jgi:hypothetical protein